MAERDWKGSVYSDGSAMFVSRLCPAIGEQVKIRIRMAEDAPVERAVLRYIRDGSQVLREMHCAEIRNGLRYYETEVPMTENRLRYQFYLAAEGGLFCYSQNGLTEYLQNETYDFRLLADYVQPEWVKHAVFYQIFPERFRNGDPALNVKDGELTADGFASQEIRDWNTPPGRYPQTHCMDFYGGDLKGVREKIPYLKELGITCLYLNPIFVSPSVHKYDCIDYEHVDPHFGGDGALAELSAELHRNGMKLILDISVNHTGTDHKWFNRDGKYFPKSIGAYNNPESPERAYYVFYEGGSYMGWLGHMHMPQLNYRSDAVRERIYRAPDAVLRKWLKPPYSIDGWRFDVADVMARYGPDQPADQVWREIRQAIREENPQAFILAEEWTDCSEYLQGDAWDSTMNYYGCARVWRPFIGMSDPYLDSVIDAAKGLPGLRKKLSAEAAWERIRTFYGLLPWAVRENMFNLLDSHDMDRLHNNAGVDPGDYRGAVIAQFAMPGAPSVYYGDEAAIDGYTDSLEGCRYPMPWDRDFQAGDRYRLYKDLIALRNAHPAFAEGTFQLLYARGQTLAFARQTEDECWIGVISSEEAAGSVRLPVWVLGRSAESLRAAAERKADALGEPMALSAEEPGLLTLRRKAHTSYLFAI